MRDGSKLRLAGQCINSNFVLKLCCAGRQQPVKVTAGYSISRQAISALDQETVSSKKGPGYQRSGF